MAVRLIVSVFAIANLERIVNILGNGKFLIALYRAPLQSFACSLASLETIHLNDVSCKSAKPKKRRVAPPAFYDNFSRDLLFIF